MTHVEFERRWAATPHLKDAELIDGVVYCSALTYDGGTARIDIVGWLGMYQWLTPGTEGADNASERFDGRNVPQPDALLRVLESHGGRCRVSPDRYLEGGPELIVEIANSSADADLGEKRDLYRRFGVREYIVWRVAERALDWFVLRNGLYWPLEPGADGVSRSEVFPGLWLDAGALLADDMARVLTVAQQGHGSAEHATFVADLRHRAPAPPV
ncbi:MAG: Uma2 family endonuclease [Planctomycetes bacterium]|nr:Uma2 family endonuclease [Planctomycetota bacterium]